MTRVEQLAYAAGLLDGDGCFHASRNEHCNTFRYGITINLKYATPLLRLVGLFGGEVRERKGKIHGFTWACLRKNNSLLNCLNELIPYILVKRTQAELLREMTLTFVNSRTKQGQEPDSHVVERRFELVGRIISLKAEILPLPDFQYAKLPWRAYVSGLMDAEASIGVYHGKGKRYFGKVQIGMPEYPILQRLQSEFGGFLIKKTTEFGTKFFTLAMERSSAVEICRVTGKYRLLKREQSAILIRLQRHISLWKSRARNLPPSVFEARERWYQRCAALNSSIVRAETKPGRPIVACDSPNHIEPKGMEPTEMIGRRTECDPAKAV